MSTQIKERYKSRIDLERIKKKKINIAVFGHGNVGSILIDQIVASQEAISERRDLDLTIFSVANSTSVLLKKEGISADWREEKLVEGIPYSISQIITYAKSHSLEHLIAIDNTASTHFIEHYEELVKSGFHLVSSNKVGNTQPLSSYRSLREVLHKNNKEYLYETNVGAGLPLIDTIKLLHLSGENITRIKGVFSGSLSYIFNHFSSANDSEEIKGDKEKTFSAVLKDAIQKGFTEPDPREDLCGNDVGRKLLILARELDLHCEFEDISIQNLIPKSLRKVSKEAFLSQLSELNVPFHVKRRNLPSNQVLRYVGDLHGDLSKENGAILDVKLIPVPKNSMLGQLKGSDSLFEIYTESYGAHPIIIQGAGAGAVVTARGVFGDILRLSSTIN
jgi:homoserine dehydrogenase